MSPEPALQSLPQAKMQRAVSRLPTQGYLPGKGVESG